MSFKWLKIDVETDTKIELPFFTGSMLRGVLGYALKRVVYINPSYQCEECETLFTEHKKLLHVHHINGLKMIILKIISKQYV